MTDINSMSKNEQADYLRKHPEAIGYIDNPSVFFQVIAVDKLWKSILFIKKPHPDVQILAIRKNSKAIEYINNPTEAAQMLSVGEDPYTIHYIKNPSNKVQMHAVTINPWAVEHIEHPTEEVATFALYQCPTLIKYARNIPIQSINANKHNIIKELLLLLRNGDEWSVNEYLQRFDSLGINWPELEIIKKSIESDNIDENDDHESYDVVITRKLNALDEKGKIDWVSKRPGDIYYIDKPSEAVQMSAVKKQARSIEYIKKPTLKVQLYAVEQNAFLIELIKNPPEEVQMKAVQVQPEVLSKLVYPSDNVKVALLTAHPLCWRSLYVFDKDILDRCKRVIIKTLLTDINDGYSGDVENDIQILITRLKIDWPELDIIKKSIESDNEH